MEITINKTLNRLSNPILIDQVSACIVSANLLQYDVKAYLSEIEEFSVARIIIKNDDKEFSILVHTNNYITAYKHHGRLKRLTINELLSQL